MGGFQDDYDNDEAGSSGNNDRSGSYSRGGRGGGRGGRGRYGDENRERGGYGGGRGGGFGNRNNDDNDERSERRFDGGERRGRGGRGGRGGGRGFDDEGSERGGGWGQSDGGDDRNGEERRSRGRGRGNRGGGRGRDERGGFDNERNDGGWGDDRKDRDGDRGRRGSDDAGRDSGGWGGDDDNTKTGENGEAPKQPINYVPKDRTEEELFSDTGIKKGVNFADYDSIQIKVSGENVPKPIRTFDDAQLRALLLSNLKKCYYDRPTPIQKYAIPIVMEGRDLMATAQTGSGKTAAFLLPIVQNLLSTTEDLSSSGSCVSPQVIILGPTRELAIQIEENARRITSQSSLKIVLLYGGVQPRHQSNNLSRGCNILIATPGRLSDFLNRGYLKLDAIRFVVLDEADRMLDMGFRSSIENVLNHESMTPQNARQTLLFSATFSAEIQKLAAQYLRPDYVFVTVGIVGGACKDVQQNFIEVPERREKKGQLLALLEQQDNVDGTLVFVEQKRFVDFIASFLCEKGFKATSIHGDREQSQREEALRDFKLKKMQLLVASNVAARGLDITGVNHVINFDLPKEIDEYVHRIGRTGRLGNKGKATSLYESDSNRDLAGNLVRILKQAGQPVPDFIQKDSGSGGDFESGGFGGIDYRGDANTTEELADW